MIVFEIAGQLISELDFGGLKLITASVRHEFNSYDTFYYVSVNLRRSGHPMIKFFSSEYR